GRVVHVETVEALGPFRTEIATSFALANALADRVRNAIAQSRFPIVLAGNCGTSLGTVAGLGDEPVAVIWLDAHGDFNTTDSTTSGFLDGMALATLTGRAWTGMAAGVAGHRAVAERRVALVGGRALDDAETAMLEHSQIALVRAERLLRLGAAAALVPVLDRIREHAGRVYLHIDLDVLDPREAHVNSFAEGGGVPLAMVREVIAVVAQRFEIVAAAMTAFDPQCDDDGRATAAALELLSAVADHIA
ncbi:MAG: arginase family protein, partial [Gemmatimonadaceae bacterium]